jgi:hypothetical protein
LVACRVDFLSTAQTRSRSYGKERREPILTSFNPDFCGQKWTARKSSGRAKRVALDETVEMNGPGSHAIYVSRLKEVAALIEEATSRAR